MHTDSDLYSLLLKKRETTETDVSSILRELTIISLLQKVVKKKEYECQG